VTAASVPPVGHRDPDLALAPRERNASTRPARAAHNPESDERGLVNQEGSYLLLPVTVFLERREETPSRTPHGSCPPYPAPTDPHSLIFLYGERDCFLPPWAHLRRSVD